MTITSKNKIYFLLMITVLLFILTSVISGCAKDDIVTCDLPFTKSLFVSNDFIYSTYTSLCGGDVLESGLTITESGGNNNVVSNGEAKTKDWANDIYVDSGYAYIANGGNGLLIVDISDNNNPVIEGRVDTPGYANSVFVSGEYAFVADCANGLQIIDLSDKKNPGIIKSYDTPGYAFDVFVYEGSAYVADGDKGLQIINIEKIQ
jgi:hypothetical protein